MKKTLLAAGMAALVLGATPVMAKTLVYCSEASPEGFDPSLYTSGTTFDATSKPVFNRLVQFKPGTTELEPGLAKSWDISDDGLEVTFHLFEDVPFQKTAFFTPTRNFNADDVIWSFERQMDKENPYYKLANGNFEYFNSMGMATIIKSIEKIDDHTVKFVLKHAEAPFVANLGMDFASIHSKEYEQKLVDEGKPQQANQKPVGTGPYVFVGYQEDAAIRYQANPTYFRGKQKIDNLVFAITPDAQVRYQKLKAGECHIMPYPNVADIPEMKKSKDINVLTQAGMNVSYLGYSTQVAPFDKPEVRRALNMAINKKALIDGVFQGGGEAATNPMPPTLWGYNDKVKDDVYDPEAARKMLDEAGVKDLSMKIWAMPVQRPYMPNARRTAEMIQADFAKVGVKASIVSYEWGEYLKRSADVKRDGAIIMGWTGDNGDPDNFLGVLLGCDGVGNANRAQWCYKPFQEIIDKAKRSNDREERVALYEKAQEIFKEQAPWATIAHSTVYVPISKRLEGFKVDPLGGFSFEGVDLKD